MVLLSAGTTFAGLFGPDAVLTASGAPVVSSAVTVYESDGTTAATLYSDQTKAVTAANPVSTDSFGNLVFYADPGIYILSFSVGGVSSTKLVQVAPFFQDSAYNVRAVLNGTHAALSGDCLIVNLTSGAGTINLPAPNLGARVKAVKVDATFNILTISSTGGIIQGPGIVSGDLNLKMGGPGSFVELTADGTNWNVTAGAADSGWTAIPVYNNGASSLNGPGSGAIAAYRVIGDRVMLEGLINGSASGTGSFTLPGIARPAVDVPLVTSQNAPDQDFVSWEVVATTGVVTPYYTPGIGGSILSIFMGWQND